jgi:alpha-amylase
MSEVVDHVSPLGSVYLPDGSYREMTEWALPVDRQVEFQQVVHAHEHHGDWPQLKQFIRGGFWRNFRAKYPEANEMYSRMLQVSQRLQELSNTRSAQEQPDLLSQARTELYRAQCNCSYWHGAFGGLYLPHLRNAVYHHLIAADNLLEKISGRSGAWTQIDASDFNLDARKELRMANDRLVAYFAPSRGGHLYELDVRSIRHNLLATLNRRPEVYHQKVRHAGEHQHEQGDNGHAVSIHDLVAFKQPDLHKKLQYDNWPRKSSVDHFLQPGLELGKFINGEGEMGDFTTGVYESLLRRSADQVQARMTRRGHLGPYEVTVNKTVNLDRGSSQIQFLYELEDLPRNVPVHFGVEFQFAGMAAGASDRYFYDASGRQLGQLETTLDLHGADRIGLVDEWLGLDAGLELSQTGSFWTFPIQTISQSEGGFEAVHQSCAVVPHWEFVVPESGRWSVKITLSMDTSVAQARRLREAAVVS